MAMQEGRRTLLSRISILSAAIFLAADQATAAEICSLPSELEHGNTISMHVIDVGQADAIAITCQDGSIGMLVDTGDKRETGGMERMKGYLKALAEKSPGGSDIGLLVVTHPDADHIGGAEWVLNNYKVGTFLDNGKPSGTKTYLNTKAAAKRLAAAGRLAYLHADGEKRSFEICPEVQAEVLTPSPYFATCKGANECSVVMQVTTGTVRFLLTGDAGRVQEKRLLKDQVHLKSSVLKVGHHGSSSATSKQFLSSVTPSCTVISSGRPGEGSNKRYNHPRLPVVKLLIGGEKLDRRDEGLIEAYDPKTAAYKEIKFSSCLYSTASDGTVVFSTDGKKLACEAGK
jgi:beta-lactamase superfamily II metal-dependent hydrolase